MAGPGSAGVDPNRRVQSARLGGQVAIRGGDLLRQDRLDPRCEPVLAHAADLEVLDGAVGGVEPEALGDPGRGAALGTGDGVRHGFAPPLPLVASRIWRQLPLPARMRAEGPSRQCRRAPARRARRHPAAEMSIEDVAEPYRSEAPSRQPSNIYSSRSGNLYGGRGGIWPILHLPGPLGLLMTQRSRVNPSPTTKLTRDLAPHLLPRVGASPVLAAEVAASPPGSVGPVMRALRDGCRPRAVGLRTCSGRTPRPMRRAGMACRIG
jgi:hypothetical protein